MNIDDVNLWIAHALGSTFLASIGLVTAAILVLSLFWVARSYWRARAHA